jgi:hypothetical protein
MIETGFIVTFDEVDTATANRYAGELKENLELQVEGLTVQQVRDKANTMDFGATLAIILGSAAATAVAKGIQAWLAKRNTSTVTIKTMDGQIIATGVGAADAKLLVEQALKQSFGKEKSPRKRSHKRN